MDIFLSNLSCVLLTVVYVVVLSCVSATDAVVDRTSRRQIRHVIEVAALTDVPSDGACHDAVTDLTNVVMKYASCSSQNMLNARVCQQCVDFYLIASHHVATNFSAITDEFGRPCSDRLTLTEGALLTDKLKHFVSSWKELNCHHCFINETTNLETNETKEFAKLLDSFYVCVANASQGRVSEPFTLTNGTLNTSACQNCSAVYEQLNSVFVTMETQHTNTVCADTVRLMAYTRELWNDVLSCRREKVESIELMLVSVFLAVLPVTFYVTSYINSPDVSSNILRQKRLRDSSSVSHSFSPPR